MTEFVSGAATHAGKVRSNNQDNLLANDPIFAVADGMGGHTGGEIASAIAIDALAGAATVATIDDLIERVQEANTEIVNRGRLEPELRGMGTTLCILTDLQRAGPNRLGIANVGDSRLYRVTDDGLHQHTEDHSLVESLVRDGRLSRAEAAVHPQRNIVTRALGIDERVLVDAWELVPVVGDRYVLCSDGLFNEVHAAEIHDVLSTTEPPQDAAEDLVARAVAAGGRDNITVVVVDVLVADTVDDIPDDRVTATRKALPDGVLTIERPAAGDDIEPSDPHPDEVLLETVPSVFTWRLATFMVAVIAVLAVLLAALVVYARSGYFVGVDDDQTVTVYQGRPGGVLFFDPTVESDTDLSIDELDPIDRDQVLGGLEFDSLADAESYVATLERQAADAAGS